MKITLCLFSGTKLHYINYHEVKVISGLQDMAFHLKFSKKQTTRIIISMIDYVYDDLKSFEAENPFARPNKF